jgi:endonuclease/exonuclease/phosphatase family metal-dependent hydrolase
VLSNARRRPWIVLAAVAALACAGPPPEADAPRARSGALRIATWNVHDLFDAVDRTAPPGDQDLVPTAEEVDAKLRVVGRVLAGIDADVLVLEEVESADLLQRVAAGPLGGRGYEAFLREGYDPRGIDVGVLSRVPFEVGPTHLDDRAPDGRRLWSRDVLEIHLDPDASRLVVLGAHLVSRLDPGEDGRRLLQAARLSEIARTLAAGERGPGVLVVGDLNDVPGSAALAPLLERTGCIDLGARLPASSAWTWSGGGAHERIDYAVLCGGRAVDVIRTAVVDGPDVDAASDHRPVVVDVWLGPGAR